MCSARTGAGDGEESGTWPPLLPLDGDVGPALRLDAAVSAELVSSVLEAALETTTALRTLPRQPGSARRWARALAVAAAVLIALTVGSGANAVVFRVLGAGRPAAPSADGAAPGRSPELEPAPEDEPPPYEVVVPLGPGGVTADELPAPVRRPRSAAVARPAPAPALAPGADSAEALDGAAGAAPAELLAEADGLRDQRAWAEADRLYDAVAGRFPGSEAAVVASVSSGSLRLNHLGDAAGALEAYQRALEAQPAGPLAEEARWGIAEARRDLGDAPGEAAALRDFLEHHPRSPLAPAVRHRLARIDA